MHRCWSIIEVQHAIFREVHDKLQGKAALARLARTCRAFSHIALDILWEELDSFVYLVQCLPTNLWKIIPDGKRMTFQRDMSLGDWETFFSYSSRVRTLHAFGSHQCSPTLGAEVIFALMRTPDYGPLVPRLKTLHWTEYNQVYMPLLPMLFARSLVNAELPFFVLHSRGLSMQLTSRCPSLKNLRTRVTKMPENAEIPLLVLALFTQHIVSETILRLHSLESLECNILDEDAVVHIFRLPSLVKLSLTLQDDLELENLKPCLAPPAFASLRSLTLAVNELSYLTSLLESVRFKPRNVSFTVEDSPTAEEFRQFFVSLVKACSSEQLSQIDLIMEPPEDWISYDDRDQVSLTTFEPLVAFHSMKSFTFDSMCNMFIDDDTINMLSKHWPDLTHLSLNSCSRWGVPSHITHRGLITLLSRCVSLTKFELEVDFTEIDQPHSQIPLSRPGNGLTSHCRSAFFLESKIKHPTTIAAFLSSICPELSVTLCEWSVEEDHIPEFTKKWEEVNYLLPAFTAVRRQCVE